MKTILLALSFLLLAFDAEAGCIYGSSNSTGCIYTNTDNRMIFGSKKIFGGGNPYIQVQSASDQPGISLWSFNDMAAPTIDLGVSGGATTGSYGVPSSAYFSSGIRFKATTSTEIKNVATIKVAFADTPSDTSLSTMMLFYVTSKLNVTDSVLGLKVYERGIETTGYVKTQVNDSAPASCGASIEGSLAYASSKAWCFCDGTSWKQLLTPASACSW